MVVLKLEGKGRLTRTTEPKPSLQNDTDVLVRVVAVGICGTDVHYYKDGAIDGKPVAFPLVMGHESAGVVEAAGSACKRVKQGDAVYIEPSVACLSCDMCEAKQYHVCRNVRFLGAPGQLSGAMQEYIVLPERNLYRINTKRVSFDHAVMAEPLTVALHAITLAGGIKEGMRIAVLGAGPIGNMLAQVLYNVKGVADIIVTEPVKARRDVAIACGLPHVYDSRVVQRETPHGWGDSFDVVIDASGKRRAIALAETIVKPRGKIVLLGIPKERSFHFTSSILRRKEVFLINVRRQNKQEENALTIVRENLIDLDRLVTHRFPLSEAEKGFELLSKYKQGVMKVILDVSSK